jgi:hypothetical protein
MSTPACRRLRYGHPRKLAAVPSRAATLTACCKTVSTAVGPEHIARNLASDASGGPLQYFRMIPGLRVIEKRYPWSFTASHSEPKSLLRGSVLPESSCSQDRDQAEVPPTSLRSGMVPGLGTKVVGDQGGVGIPSRRRRGITGEEQASIRPFIACGAPPGRPAPGPLRGKLTDVTGYLLPPRSSSAAGRPPTTSIATSTTADSGERPRTRTEG